MNPTTDNLSDGLTVGHAALDALGKICTIAAEAAHNGEDSLPLGVVLEVVLPVAALR